MHAVEKVLLEKRVCEQHLVKRFSDAANERVAEQSPAPAAIQRPHQSVGCSTPVHDAQWEPALTLCLHKGRVWTSHAEQSFCTSIKHQFVAVDYLEDQIGSCEHREDARQKRPNLRPHILPRGTSTDKSQSRHHRNEPVFIPRVRWLTH